GPVLQFAVPTLAHSELVQVVVVRAYADLQDLFEVSKGELSRPKQRRKTVDRLVLIGSAGETGEPIAQSDSNAGPCYPEPVPVGSALAPGDGPGRGGSALPA